MQQTQVDFFNDRYIKPVKAWTAAKGISTQPGIAVVRDRFVNSGSKPDSFPALAQADNWQLTLFKYKPMVMRCVSITHLPVWLKSSTDKLFRLLLLYTCLFCHPAFSLEPEAAKIQPACQSLPGQSPEMVIIPAGSFNMGEAGEQHKVTISKPFAISRCEVTFADYQQFTAATHRELPDDNGWGKGNRPVINVSWEDAIAYSQWLAK